MRIIYTELLLLLGLPFILALWIAFREWGRVPAGGSAKFAFPDSLDLDFEAATVGLAAAVAAASEDVGALARARDVRLNLAVDPEIRVHTHTSVLAAILRDTLLAAIQATPGGHVLVTAQILGGQPNMSISDDGTGSDQRLRESLVRDAGALLALRGGSVAVHATPGRGTTVVVRLPTPKTEAIETVEPSELAELAEHAA